MVRACGHEMMGVRRKGQGASVGVVQLPRQVGAYPGEAINLLGRNLHLTFWAKEWPLVGGVRVK